MKMHRPKEISEKEWLLRAIARIKLYVPNMHENDIEKLAEDLQRSEFAMSPETAINIFFRPSTPQTEPPSGSA